MPSELRCKNCTCSDYYNNNLVCWLYSDDEIYYLEEESEACPDYDERRDDYISRQAAIDAVGINTWAGFRIKNLPSAQPEQKSGKWIRESLVTQNYPYKCSICKKYSRAMYDYCPNCGADMREESDNG